MSDWSKIDPYSSKNQNFDPKYKYQRICRKNCTDFKLLISWKGPTFVWSILGRSAICRQLAIFSITKLQNLMKTSSKLTLEKVSKRRYVFLVIAPNVGRHAFLDRWRNAQKDGQGDQVRDRGEHSFAKLKVTYNQFLAWLKRTKKEQIVQ